MPKPKAQKDTKKLSENARTIYLFILLFAGIAFILWAEGQYETNFVDSF